MRKCSSLGTWVTLVLLTFSLVQSGRASTLSDDLPNAAGALASAQLEHARNEVAKIKALVEQGTLPRTRLDEAEAKVADAQDEAILSSTLYSGQKIADMTEEQGSAMVAAAQRRVDRQANAVAERRKLLDMGIISRAEMGSVTEELDSRQRVLDLTKSRIKLLEELRQMASEEQRLEHAAQEGTLQNSMIKFDGNGHFSTGDLTTISAEYERHFHHALPVTAMGQTMLHQSLGLDHHDRVDVGLSPEQPEGIWLRRLLERLNVPYLAFRNAVAGAATAPHIHIGIPSTKLRLAQR
jgi:multidrug resistance efflux pump